MYENGSYALNYGLNTFIELAPTYTSDITNLCAIKSLIFLLKTLLHGEFTKQVLNPQKGLGSPTTVLNFGFGSRNPALNFRLGSQTILGLGLVVRLQYSTLGLVVGL